MRQDVAAMFTAIRTCRGVEHVFVDGGRWICGVMQGQLLVLLYHDCEVLGVAKSFTGVCVFFACLRNAWPPSPLTLPLYPSLAVSPFLVLAVSLSLSCVFFSVMEAPPGEGARRPPAARGRWPPASPSPSSSRGSSMRSCPRSTPRTPTSSGKRLGRQRERKICLVVRRRREGEGQTETEIDRAREKNRNI